MTWRLLGYQKRNAFENMAIDEAVLRETIKNKKPPTLRFYGWKPAAVSIGYFQEIKNEVNVDPCCRSGVDLVRRITGGKAVFHCDEITYSLVARQEEELFPQSISGTYEKISRCLARGLMSLGIHAYLAHPDNPVTKDPTLIPCCFSLPSGHELLVGGRKICGSAQVRTRGGFLQHGSLLMTFDPVATASLIMKSHTPQHVEALRNSVVAVNDLLDSPVSPEALCKVLEKGFADELGINIFEATLTSEEKEAADRLVHKYKNDQWIRERKKEAYRIDEALNV